ncbi:DUF2188 domain-containing protein [Paenibacillus sp. P26]|nr:DUF2188 domain-containing protein [Paenibacillus sp. P26]
MGGEAGGAEEPGYKAETKEKATRRAKEWASKDETSAIIHRKDGTIEKSHRYS